MPLFPGNIEVIYVGETDNASKPLKPNPLNPLSGPVRKQLLKNLRTALSQPAIDGIVLIGAGNQHFSAGADISEFQKSSNADDEEEYPTLVDVVKCIAFSPKPIVAGIRGVCLGGGMEVALAADYRVGLENCRMGLPEVKIGLIPGAHGTQRLPRIVSSQIALKMITTGSIINGKLASEYKILDAVASPKKESLEDVCIHFMKWAISVKQRSGVSGPSRKIHDRPPPSDLVETCDKCKLKIPPPNMGSEAVHAAISAIRACGTNPNTYDKGCQKEEEIFWDLLYNSVQGRAYRHIFFTEREVQRRKLSPSNNSNTSETGNVGGVSGFKVVANPTNAIIGVIGAGTMGSGIAISFLLSKARYKQVILVDVNEKSLARGTSFIQKTLKKKGLDVSKTLKTTSSLQDLAPCNLIVEAVFENLELKKGIFDKLQNIVQDEKAIFASNTSTLSIDSIMGKVRSAETRTRCAGMHFFSPAHIMRLVEIVQSSSSSIATLMALRHVTKAIGKVGVVVGNCQGFVGNRMVAPYTGEAVFVVEEIGTGEGISMVDEALGRKKSVKGLGMALGPFEMGDLAGNDIGYLIRKEQGFTKDLKTGKPGPGRKDRRYSDLGDDMVTKLGRAGQKVGKGWYDYAKVPGKKFPVPKPSEEMSKFIQTFTGNSSKLNIPSDEIVRRVLYPLVNEGFKILEEGIANDPGDIDIIYIYGYGFPPWRGGPMYWADHQVGLSNLLKTLEKYHAQYPGSEYFKPSPLLRECVKLDVGVQEYYNKKLMNKGNQISKL